LKLFNFSFIHTITPILVLAHVTRAQLKNKVICESRWISNNITSNKICDTPGPSDVTTSILF